MASTPVKLVAHPEPVPPEYEADVNLMSARALKLCESKGLPYHAIAEFTKKRYRNLEDLADRFETPEKARMNTKKALKVEAGHDGITEDDMEWLEMRMYQVVAEAKDQQKKHPEVGTMARPDAGSSDKNPVSVGMNKYDRKDLEKEYETAWGVKAPSIRRQCRMDTIEKQYKKCSDNEVGCLHSKYIIPHIQEDGEKPFEVPKSSAPGETNTEEIRRVPSTQRQVERFFDFFQVLLLMSIAPFRNKPAFKDFKKDDLDKMYEWILGREVAQSSPAPSPGRLLWFERQLWQEIEVLMSDEDLTLRDSINKVMNNSNLLIRELYLKRPPQQYDEGVLPAGKRMRGTRGSGRPVGGGVGAGGGGALNGSAKDRGKGLPPFGRYGPTKGGLGKGGLNKGLHPRPYGGGKPTGGGKLNPPPPPFSGKGAGKTAGKGGKGGLGQLMSQWPQSWAQQDMRGTKFCAKFHVLGTCDHGDNCTFSHRCPVLSSTGFICNKTNCNKSQCPQLQR